MDTVLINMLKEIGLSEIEAKTYLALLKSDKGTSYEIAKNSKDIKISNTYNVLKKLEEKGLAKNIKLPNSQKYKAVPIKTYIQNKRNTTEIAFKNIETLSALYLIKSDSKVTVLDSKTSLEASVLYGLKKNQTIRCFYPKTPKKINLKVLESLRIEDELIKSFDVKKKIICCNDINEYYLDNDAKFHFERKIIKNKKIQSLGLDIGIEILSNDLIKLFLYKDNMCIVIERAESFKSAEKLFDLFYEII